MDDSHDYTAEDALIVVDPQDDFCPGGRLAASPSGKRTFSASAKG